VNFFKNRNKEFALMHCVGEYPTKNENLNIDRIKKLKERYKEIEIGFSTHENPQNINSILVAIGAGASIFEKHVMKIDDSHERPNTYSCSFIHISSWLDNAKTAYACLGEYDINHFSVKEVSDLRKFQRGVFLRRKIKSGERITRAVVYYAWPNIENQVIANDMSKYYYYIAKTDLQKDSSL